MSKDARMQSLPADDAMPPVGNKKVARLRRRRHIGQHPGCGSGGGGGGRGGGAAQQKLQWRMPKIFGGGRELFQEFNQCNAEATAGASRKQPWLHGYKSYCPTQASPMLESALSVHYWFYIYTHSSEIDLVLRPFRESKRRRPADTRLLCLMRRNRVHIILRELELYKSLPRRLVVIKAPDWEHLVSTLHDLEVTLPDMMRYASYPVLMETDTERYACTSSGTANFARAGTLTL